MIERRRGSRFVLEAAARRRVANQLRGDDLQRNIAAQSCIPSAIDLAHAADAEQRQDFVGAETGAGRQRHRLGGIALVRAEPDYTLLLAACRFIPASSTPTSSSPADSERLCS